MPFGMYGVGMKEGLTDEWRDIDLALPVGESWAWQTHAVDSIWITRVFVTWRASGTGFIFAAISWKLPSSDGDLEIGSDTTRGAPVVDLRPLVVAYPVVAGSRVRPHVDGDVESPEWDPEHGKRGDS